MPEQRETASSGKNMVSRLPLKPRQISLFKAYTVTRLSPKLKVKMRQSALALVLSTSWHHPQQLKEGAKATRLGSTPNFSTSLRALATTPPVPYPPSPKSLVLSGVEATHRALILNLVRVTLRKKHQIKHLPGYQFDDVKAPPHPFKSREVGLCTSDAVVLVSQRENPEVEVADQRTRVFAIVVKRTHYRLTPKAICCLSCEILQPHWVLVLELEVVVAFKYESGVQRDEENKNTGHV
ncbi:hypothetical protein R3P38DRAFT_2771896 [Favolaschia claudopus]|uniref:Uncharacterized protein n=1 Tax=Favolaschia claudopus TaxID=2862362 RepID=A0AAW0C6T3_9AGAR